MNVRLVSLVVAAVLAPGACRHHPQILLATDTQPRVYGGSIQDDTQVQQGNLSYSLSIAVPPGLNGMEPNLSVAYGSGGRNGVLGVGFALQGVGVITRCGSQIVSDNIKGGVNYDSGDRFCLNGERLIQVGTSNGSPEYRTQVESRQRIVAQGTCGSGPCSFTVNKGDGTVSTFGASSGSAILAEGSRFTGALAGSVRAWMQDSQTDLNGNTLVMSYTQTPSTVDGGTLDETGTGQSYLDTLRYGYAGGPADSRQVRFLYETRPDPLVQFQGGGVIETRLRLAQITTNIHPASCGTSNDCAVQDVMSYSFAYNGAPTTGRSRLSSVTQCAASGDCLNPTVFSWSSGGNSLAVVPQSSPISSNRGWLGDFNGDGRSDILTGPSNAQLYLSNGNGFAAGQGLGFDITSYQYQRFADFNGDGITDIYVANYSQGYLYLGGGAPFTCANGCKPISLYQSDYLLTGDFNGDGRADLLIASASATGNIYLSQGETFTLSGSFSGVKLGNGSDYVADFNGDGRSDILVLGSSSGTLYLSSETNNSNTTLAAGITLSGSGVAISGDYHWVGDFNGDGMADVFVGGASSGYINYGTGSGLQKGDPITGLSLTGTSYIGDFNGDGLSDIYAANATNGRMYLGTGTGFQCVSSNGSCTLMSQTMASGGGFIGDFNGDGLSDMFYAAASSSAFNWGAQDGSVAPQNQVADLLTSIVNGNGGRADLVYRPVTDPAVYERTAIPSGASLVTGLANLYNPTPLWPTLVSSYPLQSLRSAQYVVASYELRNEPSINAASYDYSYSYFYQNGATNMIGRGWLGYQTVTTHDPQLNAQTTTTYSQDFPTNGRPLSHNTCTDGGASTCTSSASALLKSNSTTWSCKNSQNGQDCVVDNSGYNASATQVFFVSPQSVSAADKTLGSNVVTLFSYDTWGNLTLTSELGDQNNPTLAVYRCTSYYPANPNAWLFGFAWYRKRTTSASCLGDIDQWQSGDLTLDQYAYDSQWNETTALSWDNQNDIWFGSYSTFTPQGLVASTTDMSGNPAAQVSGTTYTTTYENAFASYPSTLTTPDPGNGAGPLTVRYAYDARFGTAISQADANGNIHNTCVDPFGRASLVQGPAEDGATPSTNCVNALTYPYLGTSWTSNTNLVTTTVSGMVVDATNAVVASTRRALNSWTDQDWTESVEILDGLGRTVETRYANDQGTPMATLSEYLDTQRYYRRSLPAPGSAAPQWVQYGYDPLGRKIRTTQPSTTLDGSTLSATDTWSYSSPNTVTITVADGTPDSVTLVQTQRYYGIQPRVHTNNVGGAVTTIDYDGLGRITTVTNPTPRTGPAVVDAVIYDSLGRVTQRSDSNTGTRTYQYNDAGNLRQETDALGQVTQFSWDNLHRQTGQQMFLKDGGLESSISITYDVPASSAETNTRGQRSTVAVLAGGEKTVVQYNYGYSAWAQTTTQDILFGNQLLELNTSYDPQGRLLTRTFPVLNGARPQATMSYWPGNGELHSVNYSPGSGNPVNWLNLSDYTAYGRPRSASYGNGVTEQWSYLPEGLLASQIVTTKNGSKALNRAYGWNDLNSLQTVLDCNYQGNSGNSACAGRTGTAGNDTGYTLGYTQLRLSRVNSAAGSASYCYDNAGNLVVSGNVVFSYSGNQVQTGAQAVTPGSCTSAAGSSLFSARYDANGNMTYRGSNPGGNAQSQVMSYSVEGRLLQTTLNGVLSKRFAYDYTGRRVVSYSYGDDGKTLEQVVLYPAPDIELTLVNGGGAQSTLYLTNSAGAFAAITQPVAVDGVADLARAFGLTLAKDANPVPGQSLVFHLNQVTSTERVTDENGAEYAAVAYNAWGTPYIQPSVNNAFRPLFGGKQYDDTTGLYYFNARYYDQLTGRFMTADTRPSSGSLVPDSFNDYAFNLNNPALFADPSGHGPIIDAVLAVGLEEASEIILTDASESVVMTITDVSDDMAVQEAIWSADDELASQVLSQFKDGYWDQPGRRPGASAADASQLAKDDPRFKRPNWRKRRIVELRIEAGGAANAAFDCPTCGTRLTGAKVQRGSRFYIDFDIDHINMTHARRVELIQSLEANPKYNVVPFTRKQFIDIYHGDLRLQCASCNRSHNFEPTNWEEAIYTWVFAGQYVPYFQ